jgi:hypothetical protein
MDQPAFAPAASELAAIVELAELDPLPSSQQQVRVRPQSWSSQAWSQLNSNLPQ